MWGHRSRSWDKAGESCPVFKCKSHRIWSSKSQEQERGAPALKQKEQDPPHYAFPPIASWLDVAHIEGRPSIAKDRIWREGIIGPIESKPKQARSHLVLSVRIICGPVSCPPGPLLSISVSIEQAQTESRQIVAHFQCQPEKLVFNSVRNGKLIECDHLFIFLQNGTISYRMD